jgi:hypothetical protein
VNHPRPKTRGDCEHGQRPCPWVSCRHHLYLDVSSSGFIRSRACDPLDLAETCSLDVAARGGATLEEVGSIIGTSRERVRQLEGTALKKMRRARRGVVLSDAHRTLLQIASGRSG